VPSRCVIATQFKTAAGSACCVRDQNSHRSCSGDVAADLGLSRQTVSRVLGELARHELIESRRGELLVRD
jgi:DNA-binding IscR family transcriptional regulator